ncbi:hypothetical protein AVEN_40241-1 [Araneus ventricosus]|uniref:Uncharacterized protein n=1 Tax=Araneus ventricosus TaxID=182803 RepID=A0A4Y2JF42_ARAVE|nr:hypothetical protein AVEN_40241-1 [Araneus ventricosus]
MMDLSFRMGALPFLTSNNAWRRKSFIDGRSMFHHELLKKPEIWCGRRLFGRSPTQSRCLEHGISDHFVRNCATGCVVARKQCRTFLQLTSFREVIKAFAVRTF